MNPETVEVVLRWANTIANYATAGLILWAGIQIRKINRRDR